MGEFAVVTGGSTGIGRHLVSAFAEAGYTVAFSYRHDDEAAQSLVEAIEEAGGQALGLGCDRCEDERALARAGNAREHREPALRELDAHVLQVVLAGAAHKDAVVGIGGVVGVIGCAHGGSVARCGPRRLLDF